MQTSPLPLPLPAHCLLPLQHKRRNDPQRHLLIKLFVKRLKHMPHANAYALQTRTATQPRPLFPTPHHVNDKWLSVCQLPLALQLLPRQLPLNNRTNGCKGIWRTKSFRRKTKIELRKKSSDGATRRGVGEEEGGQVELAKRFYSFFYTWPKGVSGGRGRGRGCCEFSK